MTTTTQDAAPGRRADRLGLALRLLGWAAALWIAYEFTWYQQYKLTGNPGSVEGVFRPLATWFGFPDHEKAFRLGVASMEILATVLVLVPRTQFLGGALAFGLMGGAVFFHAVGPIGIDPYGDGGGLFKEALFTLAMALVVMAARRDQGVALAGRFGLPVPARLRPRAAA